jgi:ATP-binding protein involved in chromosome partitioning
MGINKEDILSALSLVEDPDLKRDLVSLGMIKDLTFNEDEIRFTLELTTPACPMKDMLVRACKNAISMKVDSNVSVDINVTSRSNSTLLRGGLLKEVKNIIAISSGKGGVGKSTAAVNLALALKSMGAEVGLMDADIYGPSIPTLLDLGRVDVNVEEKEGKTIISPVEYEGIKVFSIGFMVKPEEPLVWRGPMLTSILRQFAGDVQWGALDYLIVDLPPGTGDVQISLSQMLDITGSLVITTPDKLAVADVRKAISMWTMPALNIPLLGILENMSYFQNEEGSKYYLYGKGGGDILSKEFNLDLLGRVPLYEHGDVKIGGLVNSNTELLQLFTEIAGKIVSEISILNSRTANEHAN